MAKGENKRSLYTPGEKPVGQKPAPAGTWRAVIRDIGKAGAAGWRKKPGKFPNRMIRLELLDCENEDTGKNFTVLDFVVASASMDWKVGQLAYAVQYPEEVALPDAPVNKPDAKGIREFCGTIEALLTYAKENEVEFYVVTKIEDYNDEPSAKVAKYKPLNEEDAEEAAVEEEAEEAATPEEDEESAPKKGKGKKAKQPEPEEDEEDTEEEAEEGEDEEGDEDEDTEEEPEEEPTPAKGKKTVPLKGKGGKRK